MGTTISQKAERRITCYLLSMLIVHCALLVQESSRIQTGYPDFSIFYTAAKILQQGRASEIYRDSLQETVQRSFSPAVDERYRDTLMQRTGEERLIMGCAMRDAARALIEASLLEQDPRTSMATLRKGLFLRLYGHEFDAETRSKIIGAIQEAARCAPR